MSTALYMHVSDNMSVNSFFTRVLIPCGKCGVSGEVWYSMRCKQMVLVILRGVNGDVG